MKGGRFGIFAATISATCFGAFAHATRWTGAAGNGLWGDPANWTEGVPTAATPADFFTTSVSVDLGGVARPAASVGGSNVTLNNGTLVTADVVAANLNVALRPPVGSGAIRVRGAVTGTIGDGAGGGDFSLTLRGTLAAPATHTRETILNNVTVTPDGALRNSSQFIVSYGSLLIEDSSIGATNKLNDSAPLRLNAATFSYNGASTIGVSTERVGTLAIEQGASLVTLSAATTLVSTDLTRNAFGTLESDVSPIDGRSIQFLTAPRSGILPWATSRGGNTRTFLTYDRGTDQSNPADDVGLRPLSLSEYIGDINSAAADQANVRIDNATPSVTAARSINSLILAGSAPSLTLQNGAALTVSSGGVILGIQRVFVPRVDLVSGDGSLLFPGEAVFHVEGSSFIRNAINVPISAHGLTKTGSVPLELNRANQLTGVISINQGALVSTVPGALGSAQTVRLSRGTLIVEGAPQSIPAGITLDGPPDSVVASGNTEGTIQVDNSSTTFLGPLAGRGQLYKTGTGLLRLAGNGMFTGPAEISVFAGSIEINGELSGIGPDQLFVAAGDFFSNQNFTVAGDGTIHGRLIGGNIFPGRLDELRQSQPGRLTVSHYQPDVGRLTVDLDGLSAGTEYDQLAIELSVYPFFNLGFLTVDAGFSPPMGSQFRIVDALFQDPITARFIGLQEGATFTAGGSMFSITYFGGTGNDIVLTTVPEPTCGVIVCLTALMAGARRRRVRDL